LKERNLEKKVMKMSKESILSEFGKEDMKESV
jgi:hypothetical protein